MEITIRRSPERGLTSAGWLVSRHSFSFGDYYDPENIQFGNLRVLNDDLILGGEGFPEHFHRDMEIVTIPLEGAVAHKDSTGTDGIINTGDLQIMSAGSGIYHSEYNASPTDPLYLLQIWIHPRTSNLPPRYDQISFNPADRQNRFQTVVSPSGEEAQTVAPALLIHQDCWFSLGDFQANQETKYQLNSSQKSAKNSLYIFLIEGEIELAGQKLNPPRRLRHNKI
jgi:redox-sensitive bicupin YhaK (pirin superfamily)